MPLPSWAEIQGLVDLSDVPPNHFVPYSRALAESIAEALTMFARTAMIAPGIPTTAVPPAQQGVTSAPGILIPVPLPSAHHKTAVARFTRSIGLDRAQKETLDSIMAQGITAGLEAMNSATMLPGVTIAGGVSVTPGRLLAPAVGMLVATLPGQLTRFDPRSWIPPAPVRGRPGVLGPCLPKKPSQVIGRLIASSMRLFVDRVMIAPGIPAPGGVTAGPGQLV